MIARWMRYLLLLECCVAAGLGVALHGAWPIGSASTGWVSCLSLALACLCGLLVVLLLRLLLSANNFRIAWQHQDDLPADLPALQNHVTGIRSWSTLFIKEFGASMITSSWTMPFKGFGQRLFHDTGTLPVLLIHGYGCNSGYWHAMSQTLSSARVSHMAIDLEPVFGGIDDYVPQVQQAVETLCRETGQDRIIILAHSMGGLVARAWLRRHGPTRLAAAITLGTPHQGTVLANLGKGINAQQMRRVPATVKQAGVAGPWLMELCNAEDDNRRARFISLRSFHDNIVAPQSAAILEGAVNILVHGVGHVALGSDAAVRQRVLREIREITLAPVH